MNKYIVAALLCLLPMVAGAQELKVESFTEATMDIMDASMQKRDYNNEICAIVKVLIPLEGVEFEGAFDYSFHTNEYWVYMSPGKKMLRVKCPGRLPLMVHFDDYIGSGVIQRPSTSCCSAAIPSWKPFPRMEQRRLTPRRKPLIFLCLR